VGDQPEGRSHQCKGPADGSKEDVQQDGDNSVGRERDQVTRDPEPEQPSEARIFVAVAVASPGTINVARTNPSLKPAVMKMRI
jgi:hypothetical protein